MTTPSWTTYNFATDSAGPVTAQKATVTASAGNTFTSSVTNNFEVNLFMAADKSYSMNYLANSMRIVSK
jgi:hypothetical protein